MTVIDEFKVTNPQAPFRILDELISSNNLLETKKWSTRWIYNNVSNLTKDKDLQNKLYEVLEVLLYIKKKDKND